MPTLYVSPGFAFIQRTFLEAYVKERIDFMGEEGGKAVVL